MAFHRGFSILHLFNALLTSSADSEKSYATLYLELTSWLTAQQTYMITCQDINQKEHKFRPENICSHLNVHTCSADESSVLFGSSCNFMKLEKAESRSLRCEKTRLEHSLSTAYCVRKRKEIRFCFHRRSCCF